MDGGHSHDFGDKISGLFTRAARRFAQWAGLQMATGDETPIPAAKDKKKPKVIKLKNLKPTQIAVGMKQVALKQKRLRELEKDKKDKLDEFILDRPIRVVLGPDGDAYVIDHHHLALALIREGHKTAPVLVEADYSHLSPSDFWQKMEDMHYVYPYDADGIKRSVDDIPDKLTDLQDDPYRALAGFARNDGAFKKDWTPFAEFKWADYFRKLIPKALVEKDFDKALKKAVEFARAPSASHLPGYIPPKNPPGPK
ncbi:MAG: ParB-like protein [Alphaproteobacteria bacterium]